MQILPLTNYNLYKTTVKPSFGSAKSFINVNGKAVAQYTIFLREDLDWKSFVRLLAQKYRNVAKVNIHNMACSDGSEPVSLMSAIIYFDKLLAAKCFPINASDKDPVIIGKAKSGVYNTDDKDIHRINMTLGHYSEYFEMQKPDTCFFPFALKLKPEYTKNIEFKQADLFQALENLQPQNNVILCRNVLPYLPENQRETFVKELAKRLDSTSLVVIGSFDNGHKIDELLKANGFKHYELENVYAKA